MGNERSRIAGNYTDAMLQRSGGTDVITFATIGGKARAAAHPDALSTAPIDFIVLHLEIWPEGAGGPSDHWAGHLSPELAEQIVDALDAALLVVREKGAA